MITIIYTRGQALINPDTSYTSKPRHLLVLSNTATTVEVMGDKTGYVSSGDYYVIVDYHLEDGSGALDQGDVGSAPSEDFEEDVRPGGDGLVDIGADEATDSYVPSTDTIDPASKTLPLSQWVSTSAFDVSHVANDGESGVSAGGAVLQQGRGRVSAGGSVCWRDAEL